MDYSVRHLAYDSEHMTMMFHGVRLGMTSMLIIVLGFCFLGLLDDVAGDSGAKGFKGHFSEALHGRFTTGLVKAFLGFVIALVATQPELFTSARYSGRDYGIWIMDAAVIALAANFFNLLDLRPGRAMKVFFPALALCAGLTLRFQAVGAFEAFYPPLYYYITPALAVAGIALVLFPGDLRERFMLGDAGSNVLGAVIGLGLVVGTSFWWRLGVLVLMLGLNILSEKYSFSEAIASNRALNWIDSFGRKGRETAGANNN
jgi:UDP-GlcNAc:undecaprenyl-phosphate GlcNAc-1-phosphate transferase